MIVVSDLLADLPVQDRISPIIQQYQAIAHRINLTYSTELLVETADTNEAKSLSAFVANLPCHYAKP